MWILIFIAVIAVVVYLFRERLFYSDDSDDEEEKLPYRRKDYLLTVAEKNFYQTLKIVAEQNNSLLFAKVRLEDLFWLPKGTRDWFSYRNRIKSRHIDFVLCDKNNVRPILGIELDDSSHNTEERIDRDDFVNQVFEDANLPLLHIRTQASYNLNELTEKIKEKLNKQIYGRERQD